MITLADLLVALESDPRDALESFVAGALHDGGVWPSPRTSDGVASYRVIERTPVRARVCGQIWSIEQTLHPFWLDLECGDVVTWTLYFDVDTTVLGPRGTRNLLDSIQEPTEAPWARTIKSADTRA